MKTRVLFVHALSPLHAGTGQGVGVIDLPIAREKATGLPYLPGSSLKGTLRAACIGPDCEKVFGPDTQRAAEHAGAAQFADARLLLLPVRSLAGTFAWVTSPYVLRRLARDARDAGVAGVPTGVPEPTVTDAAISCLVNEGDCKIRLSTPQGARIVLEDLDLVPQPAAAATAWATWLAAQIFPAEAEWQAMLLARFGIVPDDVLTFLLNTATEVIARVKLDDNKTVEKGALWYEEALPAETILAGLVVATPNQKTERDADQILAVVASLTAKPLQFGGKATVGRGLCRTHLVEGGSAPC
ncbi:MAG TPA: type III-B CRISPR module RAMP protein Cmr4 [Chloroflexia bacterium]|nr:type III-B CRISPR module RAMP protein Cmr4 [Chloroflexia bacterium]